MGFRQSQDNVYRDTITSETGMGIVESQASKQVNLDSERRQGTPTDEFELGLHPLHTNELFDSQNAKMNTQINTQSQPSIGTNALKIEQKIAERFQKEPKLSNIAEESHKKSLTRPQKVIDSQKQSQQTASLNALTLEESRPEPSQVIESADPQNFEKLRQSLMMDSEITEPVTQLLYKGPFVCLINDQLRFLEKQALDVLDLNQVNVQENSNGLLMITQENISLARGDTLNRAETIGSKDGQILRNGQNIRLETGSGPANSQNHQTSKTAKNTLKTDDPQDYILQTHKKNLSNGQIDINSSAQPKIAQNPTPNQTLSSNLQSNITQSSISRARVSANQNQNKTLNFSRVSRFSRGIEDSQQFERPSVGMNRSSSRHVVRFRKVSSSGKKGEDRMDRDEAALREVLVRTSVTRQGNPVVREIRTFQADQGNTRIPISKFQGGYTGQGKELYSEYCIQVHTHIYVFIHLLYNHTQGLKIYNSQKSTISKLILSPRDRDKDQNNEQPDLTRSQSDLQ